MKADIETDDGLASEPRMPRALSLTFTVIADQLLKFLPTTKREKKAFMYYRDGMSAQVREFSFFIIAPFFNLTQLERRPTTKRQGSQEQIEMPRKGAIIFETLGFPPSPLS